MGRRTACVVLFQLTRRPLMRAGPGQERPRRALPQHIELKLKQPACPCEPSLWWFADKISPGFLSRSTSIHFHSVQRCFTKTLIALGRGPRNCLHTPCPTAPAISTRCRERRMPRFLIFHIAAFVLLPSALAAAAGSVNTTAAAAAGNAFPTCDSGESGACACCLCAPTQIRSTLAPCCTPACRAGISRLVLANLDHLPTQCRTGHTRLGAAVIECFTSSRAVVHKCRVILLPGKPSSRSGLDCSVLHAQGMLTGRSGSQ